MRFVSWDCFFSVTHHPEFEEILTDCCCNEHTVQYGVGQKKQEKFIVGKADTVVHPGRKKKYVSEQK